MTPYCVTQETIPAFWIDSLDRHKGVKEEVIFHPQSLLRMYKF